MKIIRSISSRQTATLQAIKRFNSKLCIATQNTNLIIEKSQISFLKSDSNYCEIHMFDGNIYYCSKTLKEISRRISSNSFIRVHQSFMINLDTIKSIDSSYDQLTLISGKEIPISRSHKAAMRATVNLNFD